MFEKYFNPRPLLLTLLSSSPIVIGVVDNPTRCKNFDGGYGATPHSESHGGQNFTCVGALAIANALEEIDADLLSWWVAERQTPSGGLNGRPEKKPDVCYSWWDVSVLSMLGRLHWINVDALRDYILRCQDLDGGGIADFPGDMPDVFHTFFGLAGLSMMGLYGLKPIDPIYALPADTLHRLMIDTPTVRKWLQEASTDVST